MLPAQHGDTSLAQAVVRRFNLLRPLSETALIALQRAIIENLFKAGAGQDLIVEGDPVDSVRIVLEGWMLRYKTLEDGRRQIVNFVLPGETCDAYVYLLSAVDHSVATVTPVVYADIKRGRFEQLLAVDHSLTEAFMCEILLNNAIQREWVISLGRRVALERLAHLFCEVFERLRAIGLVEDDSCNFPVTQVDLADATGLSVVHLNRTIQELRASQLISLRGRTLTIPDIERSRASPSSRPGICSLAPPPGDGRASPRARHGI